MTEEEIKEQALDAARVGMTMYKEGFLDGYMHKLSEGKHGKILHEKVIWDKISKYCYFKFKKKFEKRVNDVLNSEEVKDES